MAGTAGWKGLNLSGKDLLGPWRVLRLGIMMRSVRLLKWLKQDREVAFYTMLCGHSPTAP